MPFPSLFALFVSGAPVRRRRAWRAWLPALFIALTGLLGSSVAQATVYIFNGTTDFPGCTRSGMVYTCSVPAYLDWDDGIIINSGVTLRVTTSVTVGYNQSLQMLGTSKLIVTGNLDITDVNPVNLKIPDNTTIDVTGTFSMGDLAQTISADVTANAMNLGPDRVTVNGNLKSATSLTIASAGVVNGNVEAGSLVLLAAETRVNGTATVTTARLDWHGRVTGTIYCRNGTAKNKCDCVTNNSGYDVGKVNGPVCESMPAAAPHHFQITHDGAGDTCVPEKVTVTACADAACTTFYTKGLTGQLSPLATNFTIAAGQSAVQVSATQIKAGTYTLDVISPSIAPTAAETCRNTAANSSSCSMAFSGGAKLLIEVPNHVAGVQQLAVIKAVKANDAATMCVAAFANQTYNVSYACTYSKPAGGTIKPVLGGNDLTCNVSTNQTRSSVFDGEGVANLTLKYADAGEVALTGSVTTTNNLAASGSTSFTTVPARFTLATPAAPLRAGAALNLVVTAFNGASPTPAVTPNFDTARLNLAGATAHEVAIDIDCRAQNGAPGVLSVGAVGFVNGVATVPVSWSEVGRIDLKASLAGFLGTPLGATGTTDAAAAGCSGNVGPFIPQYFKVELAETGVQAGRGFYYSKEPFTLQVSAMNKAGGVTANYQLSKSLPAVASENLSEPVTLAAMDANGAAFATAPGSLSVTSIPASAFSGGVAKVTPAYTFTATPNAPTKIRLRAVNDKTVASQQVTSNYGVPADAAETGAIPEIRSGRMRIANAFGGRGATLSLPVMAEYWTGKSWMINTDDNFTTIPGSAIAISSVRQASAAAGSVAFQVNRVGSGDLVLVKGIKPLLVSEASGGSGWGNVALNLGPAGVLTDNACLGSHPNTTPAPRPWLRTANACFSPVIERDPSGRAIFGVYPPESKRTIHVREVFR